MQAAEVDFIPGIFAGKEVDFFKTENDVTYMTIDGETYPIQSTVIRDLINENYYKQNKKFVEKKELDKTIEYYDTYARLFGEIKPVFRRIGRIGNTIYIDLGTTDFKVIEITEDSVREMLNPPVKFIRSKIQREIGGINQEVHPEDIRLLEKYVPFKTEDDFILFVAYLMSCLNTEGGIPILFLIGEQGSAKSTTSIFIKNLLDPSSVPLRNMSKDMRDLMIAASNDFILCCDNISKITETQSDNLCKLSTGTGFTTRKLYTSTDEVQMLCKNPVVINTISTFPIRQDLADRSVIVKLTFIPPEKRKTHKDIWKDWEEDRPLILGSLCNAVSACLKNYDKISVGELPRMADFAKWVVAGEEKLPWEKGTFMETMNRVRGILVDDAIEADATALMVLKLMGGRDVWTGSASELLDRLQKCLEQGKHKYPDFPKIPNQLSRNLNKISAFLREKGILFEKKHSGDRTITLKKIKPETEK